MYIAARIDDFVLYLNNDGRTILALVLHDAECNELRRPFVTPVCLVRLARSPLRAAVLCSTKITADYGEEGMGLIETDMCNRYSSGVEWQYHLFSLRLCHFVSLFQLQRDGYEHEYVCFFEEIRRNE